MIRLKVKKTNKDAILPQFAHPGDAGMDLFAVEKVVLKAGEKVVVPTGISMEIPEGYVGLIWDKSGLAIKNGLKVLGGVIDAGYRGEILIGMINLSKEDYVFEKGHKVAQIIIQKREHPEIIEVENLDDSSSRGKKGFGSSGK